MDETAWLTSAAAARLLGVRRQTVARWVREQKLPARIVQVHGRKVYRIRPEDLRAFVKRYVTDTWA